MSNKLQTKLDAILEDKNTNLLPEHLKAGVTCLGVEGNLEGVAGQVKLFNTIEEMQNDANPNEGDLALVYREEIQNATVDSQFQTATFPNTVVLDNAITDYVNIRYRAVDSSKMFDCWGQLDSSRFDMNCYSDSGEVRIEYTSSDGVTYTRIDDTGNPVDFGTEIYYERPEMWNDAIGYFIQTGGKYFEGMFEYTVDIPLESYRLRYADISKYNLTETHSSTNIVDTNVYIGEYKFTGIDIGRKLTQIEAELDSIQQYVFNEDLSKLYAFYGVGQSIIIYNNEFYIYYPYSTRNMITYDMSSMTRTEEQVVTESVILDGSTYPLYKFPADAKWYTGSMGNNNSYLYYYLNDKRQSVTWTTCVIPEVDSTNKYLIAPTQLTLNDASQLLPGKTAYGKTGVIEGSNDLITPNSSFNDTTALLWTKIQMQYDEMEPRVLTDDDKTIDTSIYCIPTKMDGTPLYNTSNVTDMYKLLYGCSELTTIPLLNTSNVTSMDGMFTNCISLTKIPLLDTNGVTRMNNMFKNCTSLTTIPLLDASSVTDMGGMFYNCTSLTTIPLLDTSSVLYMNSMFYGCTSLTEIPLLDTSNNTTMQNMFYGCTSLTTVPILNTSKVTNMSIMFSDCTSLSEESLNNILAMCINATSYTKTKTLKVLGLISSQATTCQSLSNYQAFLDAGWTTGY